MTTEAPRPGETGEPLPWWERMLTALDPGRQGTRQLDGLARENAHLRADVARLTEACALIDRFIVEDTSPTALLTAIRLMQQIARAALTNARGEGNRG